MRWTVRPAITGDAWAGVLPRGIPAQTHQVRAFARARVAVIVPFSRLSGDSKTWSELTAVERQSAEWLGYNEQSWKVHPVAFLMLNSAFARISFSSEVR